MIDDNKFGQELLGKIKKENIAPKPKWHFLLKDYVVWLLGFLSLLIGAAAFSVIIYLIRFDEWEMHERLEGGFLKFAILTLPYFWILFLILFMYIVFYNIKHTKKGYKYSLPMILALNIVSSIFLGAIFYRIGVGRALDDVLGERAPFYSKILNPRMGYWCQADEGRLAGIVVDVWGGEKFTFLDLEKMEWEIAHDGKNESLIIRGAPLRILGEMTSDKTFRAERILPPGIPGGGFFRKHRHMRFPDSEGMMLMNEFMMDANAVKEVCGKSAGCECEVGGDKEECGCANDACQAGVK